MISGGKILVKTLHKLGVERVFCVAGESYLPVLDALFDYPDIQVITCRHESGATFMAEVYANLTGKPGIAMVTRGPGACNGSIGIHAAKQSSAPVILFVGLIHSDDEGKEAFQEFDMAQMFGALAKDTDVITSADDIAQAVRQSFVTSLEGRAGPVILGLPEDILSSEAQDVDIQPLEEFSLPAQDIDALTEKINASSKPLMIVGGFGWSDETCAALQNFAEGAGVPVAASFRRQDLFDHAHPNYVGELGFGANPALVKYVKEADTIFLMGARLSDVMSQGYTLFEDHHEIIHVYPDNEVFGKAYEPALAIKAYPWDVIQEVIGKISGEWQSWLEQGRDSFNSWTTPADTRQAWDGADMTQVFRQLRDVLPDNSIITTDAGNFSGWCNRFLRYGRPGRQLAPLSGSMGYAVPAAVSAAIEHKDRTVIGFCGDGGFMMTGQEIATAMRHDAKPIIVVCNNNLYGTIAMHQQRDFPGRPIATSLTNPDFVRLAESYGALGLRIAHEDDFANVWAQAQAANTLVLIEIQMDPRQISTTSILSS